MFHDMCESSVIHVVLTCISSLVRRYTWTTNRSRFRMISSDMFTVYSNDRVTNWLWSLAMQARSSMRISFHGRWSIMLRRSRWMHERTTILWPSEDIVQRQSDRSGSVYLKSLPVPNAIQSCSTFGKPWKWATASRTTSASTVLVITDLKPEFMVSFICRSIRVSASSCELVWSLSVFWPSLELTTPSNRVNTMTLCPMFLETCSCPRNWKSSSILLSFRNTFFQFPGSLPWRDSRLLVSLCLPSFKLSDCPSCIHPRRGPRIGFSEKLTSGSFSSTKIRNILQHSLHLGNWKKGEIRFSRMHRD